MILTHKQLTITLSYFEPKEVMHKAYAFRLIFSCKVPLARENQLLNPCKYQLSNIQNQDKQLYIYHIVIDVGICFTFGETQSTEICINLSLPCLGAYLRPYRVLMCLPVIYLKSLSMLYVRLFLNNTIKKGGLHIHMVYLTHYLCN